MSGWISIKDGLPDNAKIVLILVSVKKGNKTFQAIGLGAYIAAVQEWRIAELNEVIEGSDRVTHWMPLPELPKEGT